MPKKLTCLEVFRFWGDQHGDNHSYVWYHPSSECRWAKPFDWGKETAAAAACKQAGFSMGVCPSSFGAVEQRLNEYISQAHAQQFEYLLAGDFIYPGRMFSCYPENDHSWGEWNESATETYYTRPVVEALFYEGPEYLKRVIDKLIAADSPGLYQAFIKSLVNTDLSPRALFAWDASMVAGVENEIASLRIYGSEISIEPEDLVAMQKGRMATNSADRLREMVAGRPPVAIAADDYKAKIQILQFKLSLLMLLRSNDELFAIHRGYKRAATNTMTFMFTAGVANLINRLATGSWLFFNKTETEERTANVQAAIFSPR